MFKKFKQWWALHLGAGGSPAVASSSPPLPSRYSYTMPPQTPFGARLRWCHEHPYWAAVVGIGIVVVALGFIFCGGLVTGAAAGVGLTGQAMIGWGGGIIGLAVTIMVILVLFTAFTSSARAAVLTFITLTPLLYLGLSVGLGLIVGGISMCVVAAAVGAFGTVAMFIGGGLGIVAFLLIAQAGLRAYVEGREEVSSWLPRQAPVPVPALPQPHKELPSGSGAGVPVAYGSLPGESPPPPVTREGHDGESEAGAGKVRIRQFRSDSTATGPPARDSTGRVKIRQFRAHADRNEG